MQIYRVHFGKGKIKKGRAQAQIFSESALCGYFLLSSIQHGRPVKHTMLCEMERANTSKEVRHSGGFQEKLSFRVCLDPQSTPVFQTQPTQKKARNKQEQEN